MPQQEKTVRFLADRLEEAEQEKARLVLGIRETYDTLEKQFQLEEEKKLQGDIGAYYRARGLKVALSSLKRLKSKT